MNRLSCGHYLGQVLLRRQVAGLVLTETRYAPGAKLPRHSHEHAYFCLVRRGSYTEAYAGKSRACGPLTLAFHPPEEVHSEDFHGAEVTSFNIEMTPGWRERLRPHAGVLDRPADFQGGMMAHLALRLHHEFQSMDSVSPLVIEGLALQIVAEMSRHGVRPTSQPPRWLERIKEILHAEFARTLTLSQLGHAVGVHPVHLASAFRRHCRCTVGDYLRQRRVEYACGRLSASRTPLAEIALCAGFADQSHFTRVFKRSTGMTPAEYRRKCLSDVSGFDDEPGRAQL